MKGDSDRIEIIDAFRCIAILLVVFYHYYYRFAPLSQTQNTLAYEFPSVELVRHWFFGVQFFFIISGFVIFRSLERCAHLKEFMIRRLIRLLPALIVCSIITFVFIEGFDMKGEFTFLHANTFLNFLPGWTFTPPALWNFLLGRTDVDYIDGAYWSLSVEMMFYVIAGAMYFYRPGHLLPNWLKLTFFFLLLRIFTSPKTHFLLPDVAHPFLDDIYRLYFLFSLNYWVYFALGIFFYSIYSSAKPPSRVILLLMILLVGSEFYFLPNLMLRFYFATMIVMFVIFIRRPTWLSALKNKKILWIGTISYPLYLLHQDIGVVAVNFLTRMFVAPAQNNYVAPLVLAVITVISYLIYRFLEKPVISLYKSYSLKSRIL